MAKALTKTQVLNQVRKTIGPLRAALESPRPKELRPEVSWGVAFEWDKETKQVLLTVHAVHEKHLIPKAEESREDRFNPLSAVARKALEAYCDVIEAKTGYKARYTWTWGCRSMSEGHLVGQTK